MAKQPELKPLLTPTDKLREARRLTVGPDADVVKHALLNPNGVALLDVLRARFRGEFHVDPSQHGFNAGQRSVWVWLEEMVDFKVE